jgi:hypothetical protein
MEFDIAKYYGGEDIIFPFPQHTMTWVQLSAQGCQSLIGNCF